MLERDGILGSWKGLREGREKPGLGRLNCLSCGRSDWEKVGREGRDLSSAGGCLAGPLLCTPLCLCLLWYPALSSPSSPLGLYILAGGAGLPNLLCTPKGSDLARAVGNPERR